ncbi:MAG: FmdE family protein [Candidatus Theseobacter exili]|nr:FmdE family protein [Candidatus Theseobacter exili]
MKNKQDPRKVIKKLLAKGNLEKLLEKAAEIHGHYCSYLALGVKATYIAFKKMGITESTGMEKLLAIVECNNCFVDGIQAISGCTLGNNALIYKDLGKTAVTFIKRKEGKAIRVIVKYSEDEMKKDPDAEEAMALFDRAVKKREELTPQERERMRELWTKMSFAVLSKSEDDVFDIKNVKPEILEYAPIFDSIKCSMCGENVMETRIRMKENKPVCIHCAGEEYWMVAGRGIHPVTGK